MMRSCGLTDCYIKVPRRSSLPIARALLIAAALLIGNQGFADESYFRVVYADVPGVEELEAGNVEVGIKILNEQLGKAEQGSDSDIWATLCAAHIITLSLDRAKRPCNKAVETGPSYAALNNRGVFRAYRGDFPGAREDFNRARPLQLEAYLEEMATKDVRVVADNNYHLINRVLARSDPGETSTTIARSTAEIEDPSQEFVPSLQSR